MRSIPLQLGVDCLTSTEVGFQSPPVVRSGVGMDSGYLSSVVLGKLLGQYVGGLESRGLGDVRPPRW